MAREKREKQQQPQQNINIGDALTLMTQLKELSRSIPVGDSLDDPSVVGMISEVPEAPLGDPLTMMDDDGFDYDIPVMMGGPGYGEGGPLDGVTGWVRDFVAAAIKNLGAATGKELNAVKKAINTVNTRVNGINARVNTNSNAINALRRQQSAVVSSYKRGKYMQAALSAAQSLPGIQAHNFFFSPEHKETLSTLGAFAEAVEYITIPAAITATPLSAVTGAYDQAALQALITGLTADRDALITAVNSLASELDQLKGKGEELHAAVEDYEPFFAQASTVMQIAKLVPSQLDDQERSWVESALKIVFGVAKVGGSSLSLSI